MFAGQRDYNCSYNTMGDMVWRKTSLDSKLNSNKKFAASIYSFVLFEPSSQNSG